MGLDLRYDHFLPRIISEILTQASMMDDIPQKLSKLNDLIHALEQELQKIYSVEVEVPLCMHLLVDAIGRAKEGIEQCNKLREVEDAMMTKEFIPLKNIFNENGETNVDSTDDKKDWMLSSQLWSTSDHSETKNKVEELGDLDEYYTREFFPIKRKIDLEDDGLSLSLPVANGGKNDYSGSSSGSSQGYPQESPQLLLSKKQRRSWSPELHKRFVNALQILGGARVATPKHIKEVMKVKGLTNEEIKSHLQKYRLHVRMEAGSHDFRRSKRALEYSGSPEGPFQLGDLSKWASSGEASTEGEVEVRKPYAESSIS